MTDIVSCLATISHTKELLSDNDIGISFIQNESIKEKKSLRSFFTDLLKVEKEFLTLWMSQVFSYSIDINN